MQAAAAPNPAATLPNPAADSPKPAADAPNPAADAPIPATVAPSRESTVHGAAATSAPLAVHHDGVKTNTTTKMKSLSTVHGAATPRFRIPKGMDPSAACRVAIRVPAYVEQRPDGLDDYHVTANFIRVVDKDTINWMDFCDMLDKEIVYGNDQALEVTFFDKSKDQTVRIDSDSALLAAFEVYWESRRLPVNVDVVDTGPRLLKSQVVHVSDSASPLPMILPADAHPTTAATATDDTLADDWGEADEVEYVGVDDEKEKYKDLLEKDQKEDHDYYPDSDLDDDDPLVVDDEVGCESVVHVTDIDNPKIAVGVTFEDGYCFKRCIRQYGVINEVELAAPYSESRRYRAYCKAKTCKWNIYASQCQDGKTWQVFSPFILLCISPYSPRAMKWLEDNHKQLWARAKFSTESKCDYVTNNIAETFNSWIRDEKSLPVVELMDKIRQLIMERFYIRRELAAKLNCKVLPHVMKDLHNKSRNLRYNIHKSGPMVGEVGGVNKDLVPWKFIVDLDKKECTCRQWQVTGLPCVHAIAFIGTRREFSLEDYVHHYYFVDKFKAAYASAVPPMPGREDWEKVDLGFKLHPPLCKRAAGRPRKRRIVGSEEGRSSSKGKRRCKRCGGLGHLQKTCNETVHDPDAPPAAPPKKRRTYKPKVIEIVETTIDPSKKKKSKANSKEKETTKKARTQPTTPEKATQSMVTSSPRAVTRSLASSQLTSSPSACTRSKRPLLDV